MNNEFDALCQKIVGELPEGCCVNIQLERGSFIVGFYDEAGNEREFPYRSVTEAVQAAFEAAMIKDQVAE